MPRVVGQIDEAKTEAILDAASALFAEKGAAVSMEELARRAGVSKQTLYNRFASKAALGRALAERRSRVITAPLRAGGDPQTVLTAFAATLLDKIVSPDQRGSMRAVVLMSPQSPDLAEAVYDAGPAESTRSLAVWLAEQDRLGRLRVPDPAMAAEMYNGMVMGLGHLRMVLNVAEPERPFADRAAETARRFIRAFAP